MFPYTDFKPDQAGLVNGWDPSMNPPPSGYNPPPNSINGPPQTTVISSTMSPHGNTLTDPIYSYAGTDINGFDYQQQPPFYQNQNQYYTPANNTSPTVNGGGGGSNFIHDNNYHNGYQHPQGPGGPPPPVNGLAPTPPPSVQAPQGSPSQPPNSNANNMSYYQQCNPQQTGMPPADIRQLSPPEQMNYEYNGFPPHHYPPVNGHSQWSPTTPQQHYSLQHHQQQQQQQPFIKNDLDPQSPYSMKSEQLSPYGMGDGMQPSPGANHNNFDYPNSHHQHMNAINPHPHQHPAQLLQMPGRVPPAHHGHLQPPPNHSMHFMGTNNVNPMGPHPGYTDQQHLSMAGNLKRGHPGFNPMGMGSFNGNGMIPKAPNGKRTKDLSPLSSSPNLSNVQPKMNETYKEEKKPKVKRGSNRFNGMSEEEIAKRGLPDYLCDGLDIVFIGINPSMFAAYTGKYYDGPGNHFWQALYLSGIIPEPMTAGDDHKMLKLGIGFTNIVARTTKGVADLTKKEINEGSAILREKLCRFNPKVAVFNGKAIYEVYSGQKKFMFGRQPHQLPGSNTWLWVMPSSSARCAQLPRVADKVPFFMALRKFRDHLHGLVPNLDDSEVVFSNVMLKAQANKKNSNKTDFRNEDEVDPNLEPRYNGIPANVPQSVTDVIEDVIQKYNGDFVAADSPASGSTTSDITTNQSPASSYQDYSNTQSNHVSQQQPLYSPSAPASSPSQNLQGFQNLHQNMTGTHPSSNTTPLPAMHTLTRSNRIGVGYFE